MSDTKNYKGGCHCGKVRFELDAKIDGLMSCNCSICGKTGSMLTFVPRDQFRLLQGEDALTDYQFGKKIIHHLFCSTCGVRSFGRGTMPDGKEMAAVNARCLDDFEIEGLPVKQFDGKSL